MSNCVKRPSPTTLRDFWRHRGRMLKGMAAGGTTKDPGNTDAHRRLRGPLIRATGPGSYDEWKAELAAERKAKAAMRRAAELTLA